MENISDILGLMIEYNAPDAKRINHALKVFSFALHICESEKRDKKTKDIICLAAILHDIGIHKAEEKYKSSAGKYQEELGPGVAKELLNGKDIPEEIKERVFYLIANHHSYQKAEKDIALQILIEADFLTNAFEDALSKEAIISARD